MENSFFGGSFFGGPFFGPSNAGTHGAFKFRRKTRGWKPRDRTLRRKLDELYDAIENPAPEVHAKAAQIMAPYVEERTKQVVQIDWRSLARDAAAVRQLLTLYGQRIAMKRAEIEADDEEVLLLL